MILSFIKEEINSVQQTVDGMSSKDENIFSRDSDNRSGKEILKQVVFHSKGYKQFQHYKEKSGANK